MKAQFTVPTKVLQNIINITDKEIFFKLLDDTIKFAEFQAGRQTLGIIVGLNGYRLDPIVRSTKNTDISRVFAVERQLLIYFVRRVLGDEIQVTISDTKITMVDSENEYRRAEYRLNDVSNRLNPKMEEGLRFHTLFHSRMDFVVVNNIIFTKFMLSNKGNYMLLETEGRNYKDNKTPADDIQWIFRIKKDKVDLIETRKTTTGYISKDIWHYKVVESEDIIPGELITYYLPDNIKTYVDKSGTEKIILAYKKNNSFATFFVKEDEYTSTICAMKAKHKELFD